ncbi:hypothetical protein ACH41E_33630 [Streptomyces sp. NPDC020412]|uniref:hypothetical protein n=1 Tax=Streptomyces sp. NPDC020412 TaxID=3365073 RepID=UPI0037A79B43
MFLARIVIAGPWQRIGLRPSAVLFAAPVALGLLIVVFAANLPAAWLLHSLVEKPMMRGWSRSRKRPEPSAPQRTE